MTTVSPLGPTEMEVLRHVIERHPIRVADVAARMAESGGQARTTVLTTMERLRRKKLLTRKKIDNAWHYSPTQTKPQFLATLVTDFVDRVLQGSVAPFVNYLAESGRLTDEELELLKRQVRDLERQRSEEKSHD